MLKTYQTTSLVTFCDTATGIETSFQMDRKHLADRSTEGLTDVNVGIII